MATELTWTADVNRQVASAADAATQSKWEIWYLLASLVGNTGLGFASNAGNWTVVRTCGSTDGTSGTLTADTTDRLHLGSAGAFTANDWVFGASTAAGRSWALLLSPSGVGSYYMVIDFQNAAGGKCDIWFGKTLATNGTTTAVPTFTDGWSHASAFFNVNTITNTHRVHLMLSTRGDFWWYEGYDSNTLPYSALGFTKLASTHAADNYPSIGVFIGANSLNSAGGFTSNANNSISGASNGAIKCRNFSGSASQFLMAIQPATYTAGGALVLTLTVTTLPGANASDSTYNGFVMWLMDSGATELKGRVPDVMWASGTPAQASNAPNATPYEYIKLGHSWLPWASSSAMIL